MVRATLAAVGKESLVESLSEDEGTEDEDEDDEEEDESQTEDGEEEYHQDEIIPNTEVSYS